MQMGRTQSTWVLGAFLIGEDDQKSQLPGEVHSSNRSMRQELLPILPEDFLPHLRLELDLKRLKIFEPALRRNKGIVRTEKEAILKAGGGFAQQSFRSIAG